MYRAMSANIDFCGKIIDDDIDEDLRMFVLQEKKLYKYYNFLRCKFSDYFDKIEDEQIAGEYLLKFANLILEVFQEEDFDESSIHSLDADNIDNTFTTINNFIKSQKKYYENEAVRLIHQELMSDPEYNHYSHDVALAILNSDVPLLQKIAIYSKTILFSEDFFNEELLYKIRNHIFSNSAYKNIFNKNINANNNTKNFVNMFFSDYKVLEVFIYNNKKIVMMTGVSDQIKLDVLYDYVLLITYIRFIINMIVFLYTVRQPLKLSGATTAEKLDDKTNNLRIDIILSKIYHQLDSNLFEFSKSTMTRRDVLCLTIRKIYEDVMLHEQNDFNLGKLLKYASYKARLLKSISAHDYDKEIYEMSNIALDEWSKGSKLNHIAMMNKFFHNKKYHDVLLKPGVRDNLVEKLIQICEEHGFKFIWGKHPGLHRVKDEILAEKERLKKIKKNSSAS